jgi:hypothetical protein
MMKRRDTFRNMMIGCILAGAMQFAYADDLLAPGPPSGNPPGPPPEAIAACSGKTAGDEVTFTLRDGHQVTGKCQLDNGVLAARPAGGPPKG